MPTVQSSVTRRSPHLGLTWQSRVSRRDSVAGEHGPPPAAEGSAPRRSRPLPHLGDPRLARELAHAGSGLLERSVRAKDMAGRSRRAVRDLIQSCRLLIFTAIAGPVPICTGARPMGPRPGRASGPASTDRRPPAGARPGGSHGRRCPRRRRPPRPSPGRTRIAPDGTSRKGCRRSR